MIAIWDRVKAWVAPVLGGIVLFLSLKYWKRRAQSAEAMKEIEASRAQVASLERLKDQMRSKGIENQKMLSSVDAKIETAKREAVKHVANVDSMSAADVAKEFERLGY